MSCNTCAACFVPRATHAKITLVVNVLSRKRPSTRQKEGEVSATAPNIAVADILITISLISPVMSFFEKCLILVRSMDLFAATLRVRCSLRVSSFFLVYKESAFLVLRKDALTSCRPRFICPRCPERREPSTYQSKSDKAECEHYLGDRHLLDPVVHVSTSTTFSSRLSDPLQRPIHFCVDLL